LTLSVQAMTAGDLNAFADQVLSYCVNNEGPGSYVLSASAPLDGDTWVSLGTLNNLYAPNPSNSKNLYKKISSTYTPKRPLKSNGDGTLQSLTNTEIIRLAKTVRQRIVDTGIGTYVFQESVPSYGTWVNKGSITDTTASISDSVSYIAEYGAQTINYSGVIYEGYTGIGPEQPYTSPVFSGYTGTFSAYTSPVATGFTGTYSGINTNFPYQQQVFVGTSEVVYQLFPLGQYYTGPALNSATYTGVTLGWQAYIKDSFNTFFGPDTVTYTRIQLAYTLGTPPPETAWLGIYAGSFGGGRIDYVSATSYTGPYFWTSPPYYLKEDGFTGATGDAFTFHSAQNFAGFVGFPTFDSITQLYTGAGGTYTKSYTKYLDVYYDGGLSGYQGFPYTGAQLFQAAFGEYLGTPSYYTGSSGIFYQSLVPFNTNYVGTLPDGQNFLGTAFSDYTGTSPTNYSSDFVFYVGDQYTAFAGGYTGDVDTLYTGLPVYTGITDTTYNSPPAVTYTGLNYNTYTGGSQEYAATSPLTFESFFTALFTGTGPVSYQGFTTVSYSGFTNLSYTGPTPANYTGFVSTDYSGPSPFAGPDTFTTTVQYTGDDAISYIEFLMFNAVYAGAYTGTSLYQTNFNSTYTTFTGISYVGDYTGVDLYESSYTTAYTTTIVYAGPSTFSALSSFTGTTDYVGPTGGNYTGPGEVLFAGTTDGAFTGTLPGAFTGIISTLYSGTGPIAYTTPVTVGYSGLTPANYTTGDASSDYVGKVVIDNPKTISTVTLWRRVA